MICPKCKAENPGHARFCGMCRHEIAPPQVITAPTPSSDKLSSFFKGVGYFFTGLIVLGLLANSCSPY